MRGLRHVAKGGQRTDRGKCRRILLACRSGQKAGEAARGLADGAGGGSRQDHRRHSSGLEPDDILIDGGNSYYIDDIRRAKELAPRRIHYVDVGTSGGVWGLERGYCMMIGGEKPVVERLDPILQRSPRLGRHSRRPRAGRNWAPARPNKAICTAARTAPAISSRWCTTASNTA